MNQTSLLSGNIRQQILTLAVPLLLGNILQQLYNTADSLIVGRFLGTNAFASVGISGSLMNLFIFILDGFCAGITVILGQFYGSGDRKKYREEVFTALLLGMIIALIISGVCTVFLDPILNLIHTPDELIPYAESYLFIILAGLPFTCLYNLLSGIMRSIGQHQSCPVFSRRRHHSEHRSGLSLYRHSETWNRRCCRGHDPVTVFLRNLLFSVSAGYLSGTALPQRRYWCS